jgi:amino-acid N-acetyltransferase
MSTARPSQLPPGVTLASTRSLGEVKALLAECRLPTDDIRDDATFILAYANETLCGTVGMESFGDIGLLRSVAVRPAWRRQGIARAMCDEIIRRAPAAGVRRVCLLTTDAQAFFRGLGFAEVPRDALAAAIRQTAQFRELCPQTATAMARDA